MAIKSNGKKKKIANETSRAFIVSALRRLWLSSKERSLALKRDGYSCQRCGVKQSKAKGKEVKVCVHHKRSVDWDDIVYYIRAELLRNPDALETLCVKCHKEHHERNITKT